MIISETENRIETKNTLIEITKIEYHRGLIPLLAGKISVFDTALEGKNTEAKNLAYEAFNRYEDERLRLYDYYNRFSMSYIEFLVPHSPDDLGLNIHVTYADIPRYEDFKHDYEEYYDAKTIRIAYKYLTKLYDQYNDALYEAEQAILKYQQTLQEEAIEELKEEEQNT